MREKELIYQIAKMVYMYMMQNRDKEIARIFMVEDCFEEPKTGGGK